MKLSYPFVLLAIVLTQSIHSMDFDFLFSDFNSTTFRMSQRQRLGIDYFEPKMSDFNVIRRDESIERKQFDYEICKQFVTLFPHLKNKSGTIAWYDVLNVSSAATQEEINRAGRKLKLKTHQDKTGNNQSAQALGAVVAAQNEGLGKLDHEVVTKETLRADEDFSVKYLRGYSKYWIVEREVGRQEIPMILEDDIKAAIKTDMAEDLKKLQEEYQKNVVPIVTTCKNTIDELQNRLNNCGGNLDKKWQFLNYMALHSSLAGCFAYFLAYNSPKVRRTIQKLKEKVGIKLSDWSTRGLGFASIAGSLFMAYAVRKDNRLFLNNESKIDACKDTLSKEEAKANKKLDEIKKKLKKIKNSTIADVRKKDGKVFFKHKDAWCFMQSEQYNKTQELFDEAENKFNKDLPKLDFETDQNSRGHSILQKMYTPYLDFFGEMNPFVVARYLYPSLAGLVASAMAIAYIYRSKKFNQKGLIADELTLFESTEQDALQVISFLSNEAEAHCKRIFSTNFNGYYYKNALNCVLPDFKQYSNGSSVPKGTCLYAIKDGEKIVAAIAARVEGFGMVVDALYVNSAYRGRKLGKELINTALEKLYMHHQIDHETVYVHPRDIQSIEEYEKKRI